MDVAVLVFGLFVFVAYLLGEVFRKVRIPDILLLMLLGMIIGPVAGWVPVDNLRVGGEFLGVATLVVILFESGLTLKASEILTGAKRAAPFAGVTFILTLAALTVVAKFLIDIPWSTAILTGFILGGTSSSVVIPIVRGLGVSDELVTLLTLESALTDVFCIVGAIGIATGLAEPEGVQTGKLVGSAVLSLLLAIPLGALAGLLWAMVLGNIGQLRGGMFTTLAFALTVYGLGQLLGISGAIATLTLGITLGNIRPGQLGFTREGQSGRALAIKLGSLTGVERKVYAEMVFLLKACFFLYLGLTVRPEDFGTLLGAAAVALAFIPVVVRFPIVRFGGVRRSLTRREAMVAWALVPRGLAAAVLAQVPVSLGIEGAEPVASVVAMMVILSITVVAIFVFFIERGLLSRLSNTLLAPFKSDDASDAARPALPAASDEAEAPSGPGEPAGEEVDERDADHHYDSPY